MAHGSYARSVLDKAIELAAQNGEARAIDVSAALCTKTNAQHKRVLNILSEHARDGRLIRVRQGVYGPIPKRPDKREIMWRILRMRRRVTADDLVEMAGVSHHYAIEWLHMLDKQQIVRKIQRPGMQGVWALLRDQVEIPVDEEKAARLRELRLRRKEELKANVDRIDTALSDIRRIIESMDTEVEG